MLDESGRELGLEISDPEYRTVLGLEDSEGRIVIGPKGEHYCLPGGAPVAPIPPDAIALSGNVTEVEKGSAAMRFWVGMGAGQSRIVGDFSLADNTGATLTTFKARRSYLGGAGIGGFDTLGMDQLFYRLGSTVGETTGKWLDGKKIE
mgnify:CR=1 FL=1